MAPSPDQNNPQAGAGRPLPKKELDMFRSVVKHYEMKQYKKAIKQADTILKRFPKHGETLAMKGLSLYYMANKREEAHELVKEGLTHDMRSHVCWHVYGLLHRSERNYNEAIKAYKQALRIDPQNLQILRDLSMLQIQMRDLDGFELTRNTLLTLKPNAKINWMAFALAKHLTGDLRGAIKVIDIYLGTLTEESEELGRCFESSELALYKNRILAEIPYNNKEALDHLGVCEGIVVDRGAWLMCRAEYQLKMRDYVGAKQSVMALLDRGMTENHRVHSMYMCILLEVDDELCDEVLKLRGTRTLASLIPLSNEQTKVLRDAYETELQPKFPTSYATQQIPVTLLKGEEFKTAIDKLCRRHLTRGVPSLCTELLSLIWIEKDGRLVRPTDFVDLKAHPTFHMYVGVVEGYILSLTSCSKFSSQDDSEEPPSTILWTWYLRAGLHELVGEYSEGLVLLDKCIEHTPTAVDVYEFKARLLKQSGDINAAVECIDKGRELDKQDRYINNLTTRYMLQAGMEEEALKIISMFAKHEGNPEQNLFDMQCSWYENEVAACCREKKDLGRSLKKYSAVLKHFEEIHEDQFDFHGYCLRKVTLRSYMDVLRFEDRLFGEEYYVEAALGTIRIYLHLYDNPVKEETDEPDYSNMTAAERKKAKAIARKMKKAAEKKEEAEHEAPVETNGNKNQKQKGGKPSFVDIDPLGKELLDKDPLEEASKYSEVLTRYTPTNIDAWICRYDLAIRRKKSLMALQALHKARSIDSKNCHLLTRIVDFCGKLDTSTNMSQPAKIILDEAAPDLLRGKSLGEFIQDAATSASADELTALPLRSAIAKALVQSKSGSVAEACSLITKNGINAREVSVDSCREALLVLKSFGGDGASAVKEWTALVKARFPLLPNFE